MPGFLTIARAIGIRGGIAIMLAIALAFVMWRADALSGKLEASQQHLANEKAAHAVTTASLALLEEKLATYIKDGERRSEAAAEALEAQQARSASLDKQIGAIRSQRAKATDMGIPISQCETPEVVLSAEGL
jgi:Flp pilus assembly protein TadG